MHVDCMLKYSTHICHQDNVVKSHLPIMLTAWLPRLLTGVILPFLDCGGGGPNPGPVAHQV